MGKNDIVYKVSEQNMKGFLIKECFMGFMHLRKITGIALQKTIKHICSKSELILKSKHIIFHNISRNVKIGAIYRKRAKDFRTMLSE